jgi:hypothetical protein
VLVTIATDVNRFRGGHIPHRRWSIRILMLGALCAAVFAVDGDDTAAGATVYVGFGAATVAAYAYGVYVHRPVAWRVWVALGAALGLFVLGDLAWYTISLTFATVVYLAAYPDSGPPGHRSELPAGVRATGRADGGVR